jgi:hypothetical protein
VEGIVGGAAVAGVAAAFAIPANSGKCFSNSDCSTANGMMCSLTTNSSSVCICQDGRDVCQAMGTCVKTPCRTCNDCLREWSQFAVVQRSQTDAAPVVAAFQAACAASGRPVAVCNAVVPLINSSLVGNFGKRSASLCKALGECDPATYGASCALSVPQAGTSMALTSTSTLDFCTLEGLPGGTTLPGVSGEKCCMVNKHAAANKGTICMNWSCVHSCVFSFCRCCTGWCEDDPLLVW